MEAVSGVSRSRQDHRRSRARQTVTAATGARPRWQLHTLSLQTGSPAQQGLSGGRSDRRGPATAWAVAPHPPAPGGITSAAGPIRRPQRPQGPGHSLGRHLHALPLWAGSPAQRPGSAAVSARGRGSSTSSRAASLHVPAPGRTAGVPRPTRRPQRP